MWVILFSLIAGIIIGLLRFLPERFIKFNLKFQQIGIIVLLFSMGASIGADKELIYNLKNMGVKALAFGLLSSAFSIILVYIVSTRFMAEGKS